MNLLPEVIVMIMSVVVLSLVHLSVLSFRFGGTQIVCTENKKERRRRDLSLSLSVSVSSWGSKKKIRRERRRRKDQSTGVKEVNEYDTE